MKKTLVVLLISSILLTQCYLQNDYLTRDYTIEADDNLAALVYTDSTKRILDEEQTQFKVESDSLLIIYTIQSTMEGDYEVSYSVADTVNMNEISAVTVSEFNIFLTVFGVGLGLVGMAYLIVFATGGPSISLSGGNF